MNEAMYIIFAAWTALAAAAMSPGPNMVAVASRSLGSGRRSALLVAFGIALGGFGWTLKNLGQIADGVRAPGRNPPGTPCRSARDLRLQDVLGSGGT
jgi:hypothetical protein